MKLAVCAKCHDVVAIRIEYRTCACGQLGVIAEPPPNQYHVRITGPLDAVLALGGGTIGPYEPVACYRIPVGDGVLTDDVTICTHCPENHDPDIVNAKAREWRRTRKENGL